MYPPSPPPHYSPSARTADVATIHGCTVCFYGGQTAYDTNVCRMADPLTANLFGLPSSYSRLPDAKRFIAQGFPCTDTLRGFARE